MRKTRIYNIYFGIITTFFSLPFLAPIFLKLGLIFPAKVIYLVYSFFCHQFASRSINIFDYQLAWCARDTGIWFGILLTAVLVRTGFLRSVKWYWIIPFLIPMALDGGLQTLFTVFSLDQNGVLADNPLYVSSNFTRFITGSMFGIGLGWWMAIQIKTMSGIEIDPRKFNISRYLKLAIISLTMFVVYFGIVQIWNITSVENKPLDSLDFAVRTPRGNFFARRENAICPTENVTDLVNLDCFIRQ
jgi:uncharacterized membrane protein